MYVGSEEPTKYRNSKTLKKDWISQTHMSEQFFCNSLSIDLPLDCFPSRLDFSVCILVNRMLIHFQNFLYLQRLQKWLFSVTLESSHRYNWRENKAHIYLPPICSCCEGVYKCTCLYFSQLPSWSPFFLLYSTDFSQPLIFIALIFPKWTNIDMIVFHWCSQVNRNKSKQQSRKHLLAFTVLHLERPMNSNSKNIRKHTWDFLCSQEQIAVLSYL